MEPRVRMRRSLDGLSVGDAFGERFFVPPATAAAMIAARAIPGRPWPYTDDTEMALAIVEQLEARGAIDQDDLAGRFASRMDLRRGYGAGAAEILVAIRDGQPWKSAASGVFRGRGSFGNGAAMRVAPLGAFFAEDVARVVREASLSAEVTHAHPEGIAGAIAIAVAAALCANGPPRDARAFLEAVLRETPRGYTHDGIAEAFALPFDVPNAAIEAAKRLGNGSGVTAADTVPFCVWNIAHAVATSASYEEAIWSTLAGLGDRDTTCAIVGGVLAARDVPEDGRGSPTSRLGVPSEWLAAREALPI